ncbi:kinase-like domain-containing protein [Pilobolus umbonatus]|nr:kinase-like domain-containing protein [Pilobolus umbonatus]
MNKPSMNDPHYRDLVNPSPSHYYHEFQINLEPDAFGETIILDENKLRKRKPFVRKQKKWADSGDTSSSHTNDQTLPSRRDSIYCCEQIGPQLDLGYQWPQKKSYRFTQVMPSNHSFRSRVTDEDVPIKTKSNHVLMAITVNIKETYLKRNSIYVYNKNKGFMRTLTEPSKGVSNQEFDNENHDYILRANEILGDDPDYQYRVIEMLGQGTFGQVVKCERISTGELFSVKVIKNKTAYRYQSFKEIGILEKLNAVVDPDDKHHILRLHYVFQHKLHLCLVFELLSYNLYSLIKRNEYKGFSLEKIRAFAVQILDTLCILKEAKIIHCDLKPENILLASEKSLTLKVIDFGSACHERTTQYWYIQSRFYRSPEVILGVKYTSAIDMWSFGCIIGELFLGTPLFPGISEYNQLHHIIEMLSVPSNDMLNKGRNTLKFFNKVKTGKDSFEYQFKTREQYSLDNKKTEMPGKKYFKEKNLRDLILSFNGGKPVFTKEEQKRRRNSQLLCSIDHNEEIKKEREARLCLLDFLMGVLELNPLKRWTPQQTCQHPFITQKPFTGHFKPDSHVDLITAHTENPEKDSLYKNVSSPDPNESSIQTTLNKHLKEQRLKKKGGVY